METQFDFLECLGPDLALKILICLDDSADLVRASAVSRHWQNFVISNGLSKQLCVKRFPQLGGISDVVETSGSLERAVGDPSNDARDHRAYASLFRALKSFPQSYCIADPVSASSTDNYPEESILNTVDQEHKIMLRDSYWSSKGSDDPEVPETLIYKLTANLCLITEIDLQPFQAMFQLDLPIYASRFVRFRMGHQKCWNEIDHDFVESQECADDKFIWTYTSQVFPVAQVNRLQRFQLPEPVVCVGGFLQIELLGRVQKQAADDKYYLCVDNVQAVGHRLSPAFCVEFSEPSNTISLKYDVEEFKLTLQRVFNGRNCFFKGRNSSHRSGLIPVRADANGVVYEWVVQDDFGRQLNPLLLTL